MRKKTRRIVFYCAIAIFAVFSLIAGLFAFGYRYDFVQNQFIKTGTFQVNTSTGAEVYINDRLSGSTSFLTNSFSKSRLLPRTYSVRIQRDGYQTWQKLVEVEAGHFTHFPRVVLLPKELSEEVVASTSLADPLKAEFIPKQKQISITGRRGQVEIFDLKTGQKIKPAAPNLTRETPAQETKEENTGTTKPESPDGEKILIFERHEVWVEWIKDASYQPYQKAGNKNLITRFSQTVKDAQWYKDSSHAIADVGGVLKFVEIDGRDGINIMDIALAGGAFYYDKDEDTIYKFENKNLVRINLSN